MGILSRCFCDPFKLTYVAAIVTSVEAVGFGVLNIVFMCMYKCVIKPPSDVALGFDKFWSYYFFDNASCLEQNYNAPWWTTVYSHPLTDDRSHTTPHDNYVYQATYLGLHAAWFVTAMILMYGNARKQWVYYLPWLLVSTAITVMDITISAFCIKDLVTVTGSEYTGAMFWILALYFRLFFIVFINLSEFASGFNAFCKAYHKRSKQERQKQKMAKAHSEELAKAEAAAEARARAQMAEEHQQRERQQQQHQHQQGQNIEMRRKIPPPVPRKPAAPPELRPFSYLNPAFRPNDPTDVEGMRANSALPEDLAVRPMSIPTPLKGPYFPADGYDRPRDVEGFPRRHDSMRAYNTQAPHPALRRFSSTRLQPSYPRKPIEPTPDYDITMKRGPSSAAGQSKYIHDFLVVNNDSGGGGGVGGGGHMYLSLPARGRNDTDLSFTYTSTLIHEAHPSIHIPTYTPPTDTTHPHKETLRRASLPAILPPQPLHRPSSILYTKTMNRTHLQIYTPGSDVENDSLTLQGAQTDKLIFGGVFVPSYNRRLTLYISNSVLKGDEDGKDELPAGFWDAQWRSMREGRAQSLQKRSYETRHGSFSHTLHKSEGNETRVANEEGMDYSIRETMSHSKDLPHIPVKASPTSLNSGETTYPFRTNTTILTNGNTINNLHPDTVDSIIAPKNETSVKNIPKPSNRHTIAGHKSITRNNRRKHRKLSETYMKVSLKRESNFYGFSLPTRPSSQSSGDLLPDDPAFPILHRANHLRAH